MPTPPEWTAISTWVVVQRSLRPLCWKEYVAQKNDTRGAYSAILRRNVAWDFIARASLEAQELFDFVLAEVRSNILHTI